ncbi:hypothetical protein QM637_22235, partial [Pantoea allii]|uniref:hypothetical protein n=1 Tax=Pantoea allii TaxID=574096 RepID=UPI0024B79AF0
GRGGTRGAGGFIGVVNVKRLGGNLVDQLRLLQATLLFLFVENRADAAVVGMLRVAAQAGQLLLLAEKPEISKVRGTKIDMLTHWQTIRRGK